MRVDRCPHPILETQVPRSAGWHEVEMLEGLVARLQVVENLSLELFDVTSGNDADICTVQKFN